MDDNSAFYITPPTIFMPVKGMRFSLVSVNDEWIKETGDSLEKMFHSQLTLYHLEGPETAETICWQMLYLDYSDFVLIDANSITMAQSMFCAARLQERNVWWCVNENSETAMITLLTALHANVYENIEEFVDTIKGSIDG